MFHIMCMSGRAPGEIIRMTEKRKSPRINEQDGIAVRILSENQDEESVTILRLTKDISRFGLRFETEHYIPVDTMLKIYVAIRNPRETVTHFAKVVWIKRLEDQKNYSVGVEMTDADEADMRTWEQYITNKLTESEE